MGVKKFELDTLVEAKVAATRDLPEACDARLDTVKQGGLARAKFDFLGQDWPRTDEAEVAAQYIEKLGELVERCVSEKLAKACNTRIVGDLAVLTVFAGEIGATHGLELFGGIFFAILGVHTAEFDELDRLGEPAEAGADIKYWAGIENFLQHNE